MAKIVKNPRRPDDWDNPFKDVLSGEDDLQYLPAYSGLIPIIVKGLFNAYEQGADDLLDKVIRKNGSIIL